MKLILKITFILMLFLTACTDKKAENSTENKVDTEKVKEIEEMEKLTEELEETKSEIEKTSKELDAALDEINK